MRYEFEAIGTLWAIDIEELPEGMPDKKLIDKIQKRIEQFDLAYSRFRPDSLVTKMSQAVGTYGLPEDAKTLLDAYQKFYEITGGSVTPLIGQVMEQAGYDANYTLVPKQITSPLPWDEVLRYEYPKLEIKRPALLDFGAAGKGYLIDIIGSLLESLGITSFCIDGSGDILQKSLNGEILKVGLENPSNPSQAIGIAEIHNQSLCASSGNRRQWADFTHIIDPHSRTSPKNILATWVVSQTALVADGLATCLFFAPASSLESYFKFEYLIMYQDSGIEKSDQFPAELFYK